MMHLENLGVARFSGPDAGEFLQSQLSADIGALEDGDSTFACLCSPKGKVLLLLLVCRQADDYLVAGNSELLPAALDRLRIFVFRSRVSFEPDLESAVYASAVEDLAGGEPTAAYRIAPAQSGSTTAGAECKAAEIDRGICWLEAATSDRFIPQMLGFDRIGAVSFSKGCYPGQEIVARARYLGKVKRRARLVVLADAVSPAAGSKVRLLSGSESTDSVVLDSVVHDDQSYLRLITSLDEAAGAEGVEIDGTVYGSATR